MAEMAVELPQAETGQEVTHLDLSGPEHNHAPILVTLTIEGEEVHVFVPPLPYSAVRRLDWYLRHLRIAREAFDACSEAEDADEMERLGARIADLELRQVRLMVPALPEDLLSKLDWPSYRKLQQAMDIQIDRATAEV